MNGQSMELAPDAPRGWLARFRTFMRCADQRPAPSERQIAADIGLAVVATVVSFVVVGLTTRSSLGPGPVPVQLGASVAGTGWKTTLPAVAAMTAPLAIRRFRPLTAFWLCLAGCLLAGHTGGIAVALIALAPTAYSAVVHSPYRSAAMISTPAAVVALALPRKALAQSGNYDLVIALLVFISVLVVGGAVGLWRQRASDSQARLLALQAEQEQATQQALGRERARIAGELHDVVTHNVSMMVVQAGAARRVLGASPDEARSALLAIEESGRAAIIELQHLLGLLAPPGEPEDGSQADIGPLQPQPGLDQVRPLIDRMAAAGLPVGLCVRGEPRALPAGMDLAAYRVIQEALTNVIKHAGQPKTTVTLDYQDDALMIEIADDGTEGRRGAPASPGTGRGLLGMRERVSLYGGEVDACRRPGGGWLVRARIPEQPQLTAAGGAAAEPGPARS